MSNSYTFQILDQNDLVSASIEASITANAQYVIGLVSRYISWKGTMDFVVEIRPGSELTWSDADGLLPSFIQLGWTGYAWTNQTLTEALTGVDHNPNRPDAGLIIYLADDGTIRNYGAPVWFDPNPGFEVNPAIPAGSHDFISILTHEIFHSLGFINYTQEWAARIVGAGDVSYFTGERTEAFYGGAIPIRAGYDHYGYAQDPSIPITRGLMYEFGNYHQNRWEIGRIDLAMLADMGYTIKTYEGLSLFEMIDSATNLTGTGAGEALYGDYHSNSLSGLGGNDRIEAGSGNDQLSGGEGNDLLRGGAGVDSFDGGGNSTADDPVTYYGDRISFAEPTATQGAVADLRTGTISNDGFGNSETMTGIESLGGGTAFADILHGDDNRNALLGGPGDSLSGHGGDDHIRITAAPALADGGSGTDLLDLTSNGGFYRPDSDGDGLAEAAGPMPGAWLVNLATGFVSDGYGHVGTVAGFENVAGSASSDSLTGDENSNILTGNDGADQLSGAGGSDRLDGGAGNDELDGGGGDDRLAGGAGDDGYSGGEGTDTLDFSGEAGPVVVNLHSSLFIFPSGHPFGGRSVGPGEALDSFGNYESVSGIENLVLTAGNDRVLASDGANRIEAGAGNDNIIGAGGNDVVLGGEGDDVIDGGTGDDSMTGGLGNDIFVVDSASDSVVENSGEGTDEIRTPLASYSLLGTNVENLRAVSSVAHEFRGNGSNNVVTGAGGADVILLQDGGDDNANGLGGNDLFVFRAALTSQDKVNGGDGRDQISIQGDYTGANALTLGTGVVNVESFALIPGNNTNRGDPGTGSYSYHVTTVNENVAAGQVMTLDGAQLRAGENFTFRGAAETDGAFRVIGGLGKDDFVGGSGSDVFLFNDGAFGSSDVVDGGAGTARDQLALRGDYALAFGAGQLTSIESLAILSGFDIRQQTDYDYTIVMHDNNLIGGSMTVDAAQLRSSETFVFFGDNETDGTFRISSGAGDDQLIGGRLGDRIRGNGGNDNIYGHLGADELWGGAGNDRFAYDSTAHSTSASRDRIMDFTTGDVIALETIDADGGTAGDDAFTFIGSAAFTIGTAGQLRAYEDSAQAGHWFVEADVNGDGQADLVIEVYTTDLQPLDAADFTL